MLRSEIEQVEQIAAAAIKPLVAEIAGLASQVVDLKKQVTALEKITITTPAGGKKS